MVLYKFKNFPFENLKLSNPQAMQGGGSYFTKISINDEPIALQFPKCKTKAGIISTKKSKYTDLLYKNEETSMIFQYLESLEEKCKNLLSEKKNMWFINELTDDDIDTMLTPIGRVYKNGRYLLIRMMLSNLKRHDNLENYQIFDEKECKIDDSKITDNSYIIPLVHLEGIKFTATSIDIEFKISQIMVLNDEDNNICLIKTENLNEKIDFKNLNNKDELSEEENEENISKEENENIFYRDNYEKRLLYTAVTRAKKFLDIYYLN